jgi:hypothetical protein
LPPEVTALLAAPSAVTTMLVLDNTSLLSFKLCYYLEFRNKYCRPVSSHVLHTIKIQDKNGMCGLQLATLNSAIRILGFVRVNLFGKCYRKIGNSLMLCDCVFLLIHVCQGNGGTAPLIRNFSTRRKWVVSFTSRLSHFRAVRPQTHRKLGWFDFEESVGACGRREISLFPLSAVRQILLGVVCND